MVFGIFNGNGAGADLEDDIIAALVDAVHYARRNADNVFGFVVNDNIFTVAVVVDKNIGVGAALQGVISFSAPKGIGSRTALN